MSRTLTDEERELLRRFDDIVRTHEVYLPRSRQEAAEALRERGMLMRTRPRSVFGGRWYSLTDEGHAELVRMRCP